MTGPARDDLNADPDQEEPVLMMDNEAVETFNAILARWRRDGRSIGWRELNEAARVAWEAQDARVQAQEEEQERARRKALEEVEAASRREEPS